MGEPEIKGTGFGSTIAVMREMVEAPAWDAFLAAMPAELRDRVEHPPLPVAWVKLAEVAPLFPLAHHGLFGGADQPLHELGRRRTRRDLSGIYRAFIRIATPAYVAARASHIYETYSRNCGSMRVTKEGKGFVEVLVENRPFPSPAYWLQLRGSIAGAVELTGVKNGTATIVEGGGDTPRCLIRATWDA